LKFQTLTIGYQRFERQPTTDNTKMRPLRSRRQSRFLSGLLATRTLGLRAEDGLVYFNANRAYKEEDATMITWQIPYVHREAVCIQAAILLTAMALISSTATATNFSWIAGDGVFPSSSNWSQSGVPVDPDGIPDADDTISFNRGNASPYTVSYSSPPPLMIPYQATVDRLEVGTNTVSFAGFEIFEPIMLSSSLTIGSTLNSETDRGLVIGKNGTDVAVLNSSLPGGLNTVYATLGSAAGSSGTLNVNSSPFNVTGTATTSELIVGLNGTGTINVTNAGGVTVAEDTRLGLNPGSTGNISVSGPGSSWTNSDELEIGSFGTGALNITDGGIVTSDEGYIGNGLDATGAVTVDGMGSRWTYSTALFVGHAGNGTLEIINGGRVQESAAVVSPSFIGRSPGSMGEVIVGSDSTWASRIVSVGDSGTGTLTIEAGGNVSSLVSASIGVEMGSTGTATVTGENSTWNIGFLSVGSSGTGILMIQAGGKVSTSAAAVIGLSPGSSGTVTVAGSGSTWTSSGAVRVGLFGMGTLTIESAARVSNMGMTASLIGESGGSNGSVTVTGAGSKWTSSSELHVGESGIGELDILSGGAVSNSNGFLGVMAGSTGTATVSGSGSTWTNNGSLSVGSSGMGSLRIDAGGRVSNSNGIIGAGNNSTGAVTVAGSGSTWTSSGHVRVGGLGMGTLTIEAGGNVSNEVGSIGVEEGSTGIVTVTGAGSKWTNSSELHIGLFGVGALSILSGAAVSNSLGFIGGSLAGSTGTATVAGAGSTWTSADLFVGNGGNGTLTVRDGGAVIVGSGSAGDLIGRAGSQVTLDSGGVLDVRGTIDMNGGAFNFLGGTLHVETFEGNLTNPAGGTLAPGTSSPSAGSTTIVGNYTQQAGATLQIEIGGVVSAMRDRLLVEGNAVLGGTLEVSLIDGFQPLLGNSFSILETNVGVIGGQFNNEILPTFDGLTFDVIYGIKNVMLEVVEALLPGDYNHDGSVDAADYVVWRKTGGSADDYNTWRAHFGQTAGSGSAGYPLGASAEPDRAPGETGFQVPAAAVPEPATWMLLILLLCFGCKRRRTIAPGAKALRGD
jgi:T5SS/PEP-CTERM-associated repeat protein